VLFAHGFGQTRHAWNATPAHLPRGLQTLAYDARGHGDSDWNAELPYHGEQFADDLIVLAGEQPRPPVLVAPRWAACSACWPNRAGRACSRRWCWSTSPRAGIPPVSNASSAFMTAHPDGFASLTQAADVISAYMPHRPRKSERRCALLREDGHGRWRWHWDPRLVAELARDSEQHQDALAEAARQVKCPLLLVSGGRSDLVTPQTVAEFLALAPHARHVQLPQATHMVAGDDNDAFTATVLDYLDVLPAASPSATNHHNHEHRSSLPRPAAGRRVRRLPPHAAGYLDADQRRPCAGRLLVHSLRQPDRHDRRGRLAALVALPLLLPFIRKPLLTGPMMKVFRKVLPPLSQTERIALETGSVGFEGELFTGDPDWNILLNYPKPQLTAEEQAFLDGPVEELCTMVNDWEITHVHADLPPGLWAFIKKNKFFGMIIPKEYGGLGFSALAHHKVIQKLASVSSVVSSTVGVPNSLGPGELLVHYGTQEQKDQYLPRLAMAAKCRASA
jgi:pimeloyl-ACP methyl ester carboxylesterase